MISRWFGIEFQSSCNFLLIIKFYSLALFYLAERNVANWSLVLESCAPAIISTFHQFLLIFNFLLLLSRFGETENCLLMVLICLFSLCSKLAIRAGSMICICAPRAKWSRKRAKQQNRKLSISRARAVSFYFIFYWMYLNLRGDVTLDKRDDSSLTRTFESPRESSHHAVIESGFDLTRKKS